MGVLGWGQKVYVEKVYVLFPSLDVPIRGAQFAADRIAPIRSDLESHDSNRNPKFHWIRCDVFTIFSNV